MNYSFSVIKITAGEYVAADVKIYYMGLQVYRPLNVFSVFVCVYVISNQGTSKKPHVSE